MSRSEAIDQSALTAERPLARHAVLEADQFCQCGYNLHGQVVQREERLGFMVCRCPECGKFHPAGAGTSANSVWLNRLAVVGLAWWILTVLAGTVTLLIILGAMQIWYAETMRYDYYRSDGNTELFFVFFFSGLTAVVTGMLVPVVLWHIRRRWQWIASLLPLLPFGFIAAVEAVDKTQSTLAARSITSMAGAHATMQFLAVMIGILIGRPIARVLIRLLIPPKARQVLGFLWTVDGKPVLSAKEGVA